jgi:tetratricopeptide (TPR) repeat protein
MDDLKIPVILLLVVLVISAFLFNPFEKTPTKFPKPTVNKMPQHKFSDNDLARTTKEAKKLFQNNDYSKVLELLQKYKDEQSYEIQKMLAFSLAASKKFDEAIVAFEKTLKIRMIPENGYSLAYLYEITGRTKVARMLYEDLLSASVSSSLKKRIYEGLARTASFENDTRKTIKFNLALIKKYPSSPEGFIAMIKLMKMTGKTKGLDKLLKRGDQFHKNNFEYNFWIGNLYFEMGNFQKALTRFKTCIKLDASNSTPYYYSYRILKRQKNIEQALKELEKYYNLNPLLPHIFFEASIDAKNDGQIDLAYKFIRNALTSDRTLLGRDDKGTLKAVERNMKKNKSKLEKDFFYSFYDFINGDFKAAKAQLQKLLPLIKDTHTKRDARKMLAECRLIEKQEMAYQNYLINQQRAKQLKNQPQKSNKIRTQVEEETEIDVLKKKAMMNPNDLRLQYLTGLKLAEAGDLKASKTFLQSALRLNPNILEANFSLAKIYIHEKNSIEARKHINKALKINPNSSQALSLSANLYLENNDFSRATSDAEGALKSNPNNGEARLVLAQIHVRNHDFAAAINEIDLGLEVEAHPQRRDQLIQLKRSLRE